jgi:hypothetical protein
MRAKTLNYPSGPVVAFGGIEYVGYEWREVPAGFESAAESHPYLLIEDVKPEAAPVPEIEPEPAKPKPRRRTRRKTAPKEDDK